MGLLERVTEAIDYFTGRWWFYVAMYVLGFWALPPYASKGYSLGEEVSKVVWTALSHAITYRLVDLVWPSLLLHVVLLLVLVALARWGEKASLLFDLYALAEYALLVGQGFAYTEEYGFVVLTGNVLLVSLVAALWAWECVVRRNRIGGPVPDRRRLWVAPLAALAFWSPVKPVLDPYLLLRWLLAGYYGVAYCLTTPVILSILILYYPRVNVAVMRFMAFPGLVFGTYILLAALFGGSKWNALLHMPLVVTCIYALYLSTRRVEPVKAGKGLEVL